MPVSARNRLPRSRNAPASRHRGELGPRQAALVSRRAWTIPVAVIGWLILSGVAIALWRHPAPGIEGADALT